MPLGLQRLDLLDREEAERAIGPAVMLGIPVSVSLDARARVTRARATGRFGTPPGDTLIWTMRPSIAC